jgi:hypothetical protein
VRRHVQCDGVAGFPFAGGLLRPLALLDAVDFPLDIVEPVDYQIGRGAIS